MWMIRKKKCKTRKIFFCWFAVRFAIHRAHWTLNLIRVFFFSLRDQRNGIARQIKFPASYFACQPHFFPAPWQTSQHVVADGARKMLFMLQRNSNTNPHQGDAEHIRSAVIDARKKIFWTWNDWAKKKKNLNHFDRIAEMLRRCRRWK